jgi:hypothetical protein
MSITYLTPQKANPYPRAVLAPTPELRARAAIDEAIRLFLSVARAGGLIGLFLGMMRSFTVDAEGDFMLWLIWAMGFVTISLILSANDLRLASKRPKFHSGVGGNDIKSIFLNWLLWAALISASASGIVCLFWYKQFAFSRADGMVLFCLLMIMGQLISILKDTLRGAKLLRFAQSVIGDVSEPLR